MSEFSLGSLFFQQDGYLLPRDTRDGEALSPKLSWSDVPAETQSFVLVMESADSYAPQVHWVLFDIPAWTRSLPEGYPRVGIRGQNDFEHQGYEGPNPPVEQGDHRYRFLLYALGTPSLGLSAGATAEEVKEAMAAHVLGCAELRARYRSHRRAEFASAAC